VDKLKQRLIEVLAGCMQQRGRLKCGSGKNGSGNQGCSGAGTQRNAVPANSFEPERRSGKYCWSQAER